MSANPGFSGMKEPTPVSRALRARPLASASADSHASGHTSVVSIEDSDRFSTRPLSRWSNSVAKRLFDLTGVILSLPLTVPAILLAGLAVRLTSKGPVLFRQQRMGRDGRTFTIYKFRTMPVRRNPGDRPAVTTSINQRFTPVGPFLRRWKLDELPQLLHILRGDMSFVGPRPKLPRHQATRLSCRPGITGRATIVFAREEVALASVPSGHLDSYYHGVVLPLKHMLDEDYMSRATFASDLNLIWKSVMRDWDDVALTDLPTLQPHLAEFTNSLRTIPEWNTRGAGPVRAQQSLSMGHPWQQG